MADGRDLRRIAARLLAGAVACAACAAGAVLLMHRLVPVPDGIPETASGYIDGAPGAPPADGDGGLPERPVPEREWFPFMDGKVYVLEGVPANPYGPEDFFRDDRGRISIDGGRIGIDASAYQQGIDWEAVAADGISFAILRCGLRGYGTGEIAPDDRFAENLAGAKAAGLDVGAYFFSQAVSPEEAVEEAEYVLYVLGDTELELPVWFDWERQDREGSRTADADGGIMTECALAFMERIEAAGRPAGVYFNALEGYLGYDLAALAGYPWWFAGYERDDPGFRYAVSIWQQSCTGTVAGIEGNVDLDLMLP